MRSSIVVILMLYGSSAVVAQPVMYWDDVLGEPGTTVTSSSSGETIPVDLGLSGANQVWDFSTVQTSEQKIRHWVDPSTTPYASTFPTANRCLASDVGGMDYYSYFQLTESDYWTLGYVWWPFMAEYNNTMPIYDFPIFYPMEWIMMNEWEEGFLTFLDSTYNEVDGWGTVIDETGTYIGCLRIKSHNTFRSYFMGELSTIHTQWIYTYEAVGYGPVVGISSRTNEINPNFTEGYFSRITDITGVQIGPEPGNITLYPILEPAYPNPFNPETNLSFSVPVAGNAVLSIFDIQGKEVSVIHDGWLQPGFYRDVFNADGLAGGVYIARLTAGDSQITQKLVLVK